MQGNGTKTKINADIEEFVEGKIIKHTRNKIMKMSTHPQCILLRWSTIPRGIKKMFYSITENLNLKVFKFLLLYMIIEF